MGRPKADSSKKPKSDKDEGAGDIDLTKSPTKVSVEGNEENTDDVIEDDVTEQQREHGASTSTQLNDANEQVNADGSEVGTSDSTAQNSVNFGQGVGFEMDPNWQMLLLMQNQAWQQLSFMNQLKMADQNTGAEAAAGGNGGPDCDLDVSEPGLKDGKMADILKGIKAKLEDKIKKAPGVESNLAEILNQAFVDVIFTAGFGKGSSRLPFGREYSGLCYTQIR